MARDRQRAKQRQAERREARLAGRGGDGAAAGRDSTEDGRPAAAKEDRGGIAPPGIEVETGADLAANAPPEDAGRSDTVVESPAPPLVADPELEPEEAEVGRREATRPERADGRERGRVMAFLAATWAELQRVQWPNRTVLTQLTAVVLGFVLIAGGYLGLLDAIFSRIIEAIL